MANRNKRVKTLEEISRKCNIYLIGDLRGEKATML